MKWIRWKGLIAFIAIVGLIAGVWLLIIDGMVERAIEKTGTAVVGAKVELKGADLTLFPLGLTLMGLEVANPDEPMTNAVEAEKITMLMDGMNLLRRKVIIEELSAAGVRFGTQRKTSGAVKKKTPEKGVTPLIELKLPAFKVPDPKEIIEKEGLESIKLIEAVRADMASGSKRWGSEIKTLMDEKKIEEYRARIEKLKVRGPGVGAIGGIGEAVALQKEIKADVDRIKGAVKDFEGDIKGYEKRIKDVAGAPLRDIARLKEKYSFSRPGLEDLASALIGGRIGGWLDTALRWRKRYEPIVKRAAERRDGAEVVRPPRGKGVEVRFREYEPMPEFLIRKALVSVMIESGDISGTITDITPDQDVLGRPLRFAFHADGLKDLGSIRLDGSIDRTDPGSPRDSIEADVRGYRLKSFALSESEDFPISIEEGLVDLKVKAELRGKAIEGSLVSSFRSLRIRPGLRDDGDIFVRAITEALSGIRGFNVKADVTGTVDDYGMKISTDLGRALGESAGKAVAGLSKDFEEALRKEVLSRTTGPLEEMKKDFTGLEAIEKELAGRLKLGDTLLRDITKGAAPGIKLPGLP